MVRESRCGERLLGGGGGTRQAPPVPRGAPLHLPSRTFSAEVYGPWAQEARDFLGAAAAGACARSPALAGVGADAPVGFLGAWHCRLSCALQKANATSILHAGRVADGADFGWATG